VIGYWVLESYLNLSKEEKSPERRLIRLLTPWPALLIEEEERILMASDLHLGVEYELAKMGINIPYQTDRILGELLTIVREHKPDRLILLGDIKHGVPITSFQERREIPLFFSALLEEVEIIDVARGNHDGNLQNLVPERVIIHPSRGFTVGEKFRISAMHGHAWPYPLMMSTDLLVMGHNHPTVLLNTPLGIRVSKRTWIKGRCDSSPLAEALLKQSGIKSGDNPLRDYETQFGETISDPQMVIIPAFNDLLGGLPVNTEAPKSLLGPLLRTGAVSIEGFEVYLLDGTFLGSVEFLRTLS
jgi:metallophosphoesterase superfamily enzyme